MLGFELGGDDLLGLVENNLDGVRAGVLGFELRSGEPTGYSWIPDSGEKSDRSSSVNIGGGGRSEVAKFSRHRAETAAAWPGVVNLPDPLRRFVTGVAKSLKNNDCLPLDLGVL